MVLQPLARRGARHPHEAANTVTQRLMRFTRGEFAGLWARDVGPQRKMRTRADTAEAESGELPAAVVRGVRALVEEGAWGKAAKLLVSRGLADITDPSTKEKLRTLNPLAPP
jgi:hypothetical protein